MLQFATDAYTGTPVTLGTALVLVVVPQPQALTSG